MNNIGKGSLFNTMLQQEEIMNVVIKPRLQITVNITVEGIQMGSKTLHNFQEFGGVN